MSVCSTTDAYPSGGHRGRAFLEQARSVLPHDAIALAVLDPRHPRPDGFLSVAGVDAERVVAWCGGGHLDDPLWRQAYDTGHARGSIDGHGSPLPPGHGCIVHTLPASLDHRRVWLLLVGRAQGGFSDVEHTLAALLLRLKQLDFDHCAEPGLGRLLVDRQDRLLHADPRTEARLLADPPGLARFMSTFRQIVAQRWPHGPGWTSHDVILQQNDAPTWVRFTDSLPLPDLPPHRYLEFRPAGPEDPPAIGLLGDVRVAQALGYLSDHYHQAPNLRALAESARISPFHFHRLFSREVGVSPKHFLLRTQMMIAKWMLATTREPVNQIAATTGFSSHGHFTATFHRLVGASPSDYRETHRA